jgi:hypothetical protein
MAHLNRADEAVVLHDACEERSAMENDRVGVKATDETLQSEIIKGAPFTGDCREWRFL